MKMFLNIFLIIFEMTSIVQTMALVGHFGFLKRVITFTRIVKQLFNASLGFVGEQRKKG